MDNFFDNSQWGEEEKGWGGVCGERM